ncbi:MAG: hypothetical protein EXQ89_06610 [Rhodospirillaceae bacterium]|nr:hypothetical protein [Rhodospirillaceae bacterium]
MALAPSTARFILVAFAHLASTAAMIAPAVVNGFPLVYDDTGIYIRGAFPLAIAPERPIFYSLMIAALLPSAGWGLWPVVLAQGFFATFVLSAAFRHIRGPKAIAGVVGLAAALTPLTALPWLASQITPDIFAPILVLALFLLACGEETLSGRTRAGLFALAVFSMALHFSHLFLGIALMLMALATRRFGDSRLSLKLPVAAVVMAIVGAGAVNVALTRDVFPGRGGPIFVLSRLVQDGIVHRFLQETCPSPDYRLCAFRDTLPKTADQFLRMDTRALDRMGGWGPAGIDEAGRIIAETLVLYPGMHLRAAVAAIWRQFLGIRTGEGLSPNFGPTRSDLETYLPAAVPAFDKSLQQQGRLDFLTLNLVHIPAGVVGQIFLILALIFARDTAGGGLTTLFGFVAAGLVANAIICGILSNPNDRYQSRMIWLVALAVALAIVGGPRLGGPRGRQADRSKNIPVK